MRSFIDSAYGMSWTDADESKMMWDRYGTDKGNGVGVRVGVEARFIACALCEFWSGIGIKLNSEGANECRQDKVSIRPVEYLSECELKDSMNLLKTEQGQQEIAACDREYFHKKSDSLKDEQEIRIFTQVLNDEMGKIGLGLLPHEFLNVKFDPKHIKSIFVCPYAHEGEIARTILRLYEKGFGTDLVRMGHVE